VNGETADIDAETLLVAAQGSSPYLDCSVLGRTPLIAVIGR